MCAIVAQSSSHAAFIKWSFVYEIFHVSKYDAPDTFVSTATGFSPLLIVRGRNFMRHVGLSVFLVHYVIASISASWAGQIAEKAGEFLENSLQMGQGMATGKSFGESAAKVVSKVFSTESANIKASCSWGQEVATFAAGCFWSGWCTYRPLALKLPSLYIMYQHLDAFALVKSIFSVPLLAVAHVPSHRLFPTARDPKNNAPSRTAYPSMRP